ncbi:myeloid cell nuclear differentiation antigen isoform X2 [Castor canadensis]|uniref:Myeloid cell nuclear differentiation antigen isoform X2 n=1 Tax=Castor canadensis TaxID=51338 RepID=A0AC58KG54_CASCN|nr:interferon-activable protein 203-like isoform X1 [Castor canadensis]
MVNEYKKIVLLTGLYHINDYQFRIIKSLLAHELKLTKKMQDDYDKIKIADLMEDKFRSDAGVDKLVGLFKSIPELEDLSETLKKEKLKVKRKFKRRGTRSMQKKDDEPSTAKSTSTTKEDLQPKSITNTPLSKHQKRKLTITKKEKKKIFQKSKDKTKKTKDSKRKQLTQEPSQRPEPSASGRQQMQVFPQTPHVPPAVPSTSSSIKDSCGFLQPGPMMYIFGVNKQEKDFPDLQEGKEMKNSTTKTKDSRNLLLKSESWVPETSATSTGLAQSHPQTPPRPPPSPLSKSSVKKRKDTIIQTPGIMGTQVSQKQFQHPELPTTSTHPTVSFPQTSQFQLPELPTTSTHPTVSFPQTLQFQLPELPTTSTHPTKPRVTAVPKEPSNECGYHRECKEVMVLKATKPFIYEYLEGERSMFHATVATEKEFFRVKVFDISLKEKFIPNKIITISDYIGRNGFLEIYSLSCVDFASPDQKMNIPISLKQNANANPKIKYLCSQTKGKCVDGVFLVHKKTVRRGCTYYEIQDNTGKMEVVVYGRLTNIDCEEGDKLKLFCFELAFSTDKCQLRSVIHSYIEVIKARKSRTKNSQSCFKYGNFTNTSFAKAWMPGWGCK